jgi:putative peptide zinc metalloprotease protein
MLFVPWSIRLHLPAVLEAASHAELYAPVPAQVSSITVHEGQAVRAGTVLMQIEAPELEKNIQLTRKRIVVEELKARREIATAEERAKSHVTTEALRTRLSQLEGYQEQARRLMLTAPFDGIVTDRAEGLSPGQWVKRDLPLAYVIDPAAEEIHALVPEVDVQRLAPGQSARFVPESVDRVSLRAVVQEVRALDETTFTVPYLASVYGGAVPVREDTAHTLKPESSIYRVTLRLEQPAPQWGQAVRGTVVVQGAQRSVAQQMWEQIVRVVIRESGL